MSLRTCLAPLALQRLITVPEGPRVRELKGRRGGKAAKNERHDQRGRQSNFITESSYHVNVVTYRVLDVT